jgi:hypothetical protein
MRWKADPGLIRGPEPSGAANQSGKHWLTVAKQLRIPIAALVAVVYWFPVRRWFSRWGTTPEELARAMPGDALSPNATEMSMQAVTVDADPEDIWPWLVQIGYQRGGLYSYDWLDRLFGFLDRPSATRILPEFQQLAVGDKIPWGRTATELTVGALEPLRALALSYQARDFVWVWQFGLYPLEDQRTRFVTRGTERVPKKLLWWLGMRITEPAAFIMTRRTLLNVKERAEALRASRE